MSTTPPIETAQPCPDCNSSDALSRWDDHTYCFSCTSWKPIRDQHDSPIVKKAKSMTGLIRDGVFTGLPKRALREETCKRFGYSVARVNGEPVQIAPYRDQAGAVVAQKVREAGKKFRTTGNFDNVQLWGQHLWQEGGKRLVLVEGEIDCLSYHQANPTWPVVSVPNGANSLKAIKNNIAWLESFTEVVFLFDNDTAGEEGAKACAALLTPGKAKIATLPLKDPNEMLIANRLKELRVAVYQAKEHRPDGVINAAELWAEVSKPQTMGSEYPFESWNQVFLGLHPREIVTLTAGSGCGKSTIAAQIAHHYAIHHNHRVGYIALEESTSHSALRFMSITAKQALHLPNNATQPELKQAFDDSIGGGNVILYDHFGSQDSDHLISKMRYMVLGLDCKLIVLDHLSILLSGGDCMVGGGDERKQIDHTMSRLRQFTEQYGCTILLISHLKRSGGDVGFEDGAEPTLSSLRGSQSVAQLSDSVIAISRNASEGENKLKVKSLKNRRTGRTGLVGYLSYCPSTAVLSEVKSDDFEDMTEI